MNPNTAAVILYSILIVTWTLIVYFLCFLQVSVINVIFVLLPYAGFVLGLIYYQDYQSTDDSLLFLADVLPFDIIVVFLTLISLLFFNNKLDRVDVYRKLTGITLIVSSMIRFAMPQNLRYLQNHIRYSLVNMGISVLIMGMFDIAIKNISDVKVTNNNMRMFGFMNDPTATKEGDKTMRTTPAWDA